MTRCRPPSLELVLHTGDPTRREEKKVPSRGGDQALALIAGCCAMGEHLIGLPSAKASVDSAPWDAKGW